MKKSSTSSALHHFGTGGSLAKDHLLKTGFHPAETKATATTTDAEAKSNTTDTADAKADAKPLLQAAPDMASTAVLEARRTDEEQL